MKVKIERLDHQGRGIAKVDGVTTFVPNALVEEVVDIEIIEQKKKFNIAKIKKYIEQSPNRIEPICPCFNLCGGCDLMMMDYRNQLKFKQNKIINIIERYTSIEPKKIKNILYSNEYYYRNKVTFQVKEKIGFYDKKSYDIVPINHCYIASEKINEILSILNTCDLNGVSQIMIRNNDSEGMVVVYSKQVSKEIIKKLKDTCSLIQYDGEYRLISGSDYLIDNIGKYKFVISPASFFQVNRNTVKLLYDKVLEYLQPNKDDIILDLYSGTGTIGIYVSSFVKNVISIEINKYAVQDALKNKELNDIKNIDFICDDVSNVIDKIKQKINSIIVDPPRSGLDTKTINYLKLIRPNKIIYVSCDPITLARDLENLSTLYDVKEITPVDMFPNTSHVECVSVLHRKSFEK